MGNLNGIKKEVVESKKNGEENGRGRREQEDLKWKYQERQKEYGRKERRGGKKRKEKA